MFFSKAQQLFRLTFVLLFSTAPATLTIITEPTDAACYMLQAHCLQIHRKFEVDIILST